MLRTVTLALLFFFLIPILGTAKEPGGPDKTVPWKVKAQYGTVLSIPIPDMTTSEDLEYLLKNFQTSRKDNTLSKLGLPKTTAGGIAGDYAILMLLIFDEEKWTSLELLKKSMAVAPDSSFYKEYNSHIRAYYYYTALGDAEEGSIGYAEGSTVYTKPYKLLFKSGM
jgi:hypothetical protein